MAHPLTKRDRNGDLYTRPPEIEGKIDRALGETLKQVLVRVAIIDHTSPDQVPSECLVHVIRDARRRDDQPKMNALLTVLLSRCERVLLAKIPDGRFENANDLREEVQGRFSELFAVDNSNEDEHSLDYFEIRFNSAFSTLRADVVRREMRRRAHFVPLPDRNDEDEAAADDTQLSRLSATLSTPPTQEIDLVRQELHDAIDALPADERQAVMLRFLMEYDVESDDPEKVTVAKLCGVTGRTIRLRLGRALTKLAQYLEDA